MRGHRPDEKGASLVEVLLVVVLLGVLSYVALVTTGSSQTTLQCESALRKLSEDVRLAQQFALTYGVGTSVHIDLTNNRYKLVWEDGSYLEKPVGGGNFVVQFGTGHFREVVVTATELTDGRLDFLPSGQPRNAGETFAGLLTLAALNDAKALRVSANTGLLTVDEL